MQNVRGFPAKINNIDKEYHINDIIKQTKPDIMTIMETGIYEKESPNLPLAFDKYRANNINNKTDIQHQTPNGAGMAMMTTNKVLI